MTIKVGDEVFVSHPLRVTLDNGTIIETGPCNRRGIVKEIDGYDVVVTIETEHGFPEDHTFLDLDGESSPNDTVFLIPKK